jgi:hypothetical protein
LSYPMVTFARDRASQAILGKALSSKRFSSGRSVTHGRYSVLRHKPGPRLRSGAQLPRLGRQERGDQIDVGRWPQAPPETQAGRYRSRTRSHGTPHQSTAPGASREDLDPPCSVQTQRIFAALLVIRGDFRPAEIAGSRDGLEKSPMGRPSETTRRVVNIGRVVTSRKYAARLA